MAKKTQTQTFKGGHGNMYILATLNTTKITFTDTKGNVLCWNNAGKSGFKGARRSTPYAATTSIEDGLKKAREMGLSEVSVFIKGPGPGRDAVLRVLKAAGIEISQIADVTPIPHNGCRPKKTRRV